MTMRLAQRQASCANSDVCIHKDLINQARNNLIRMIDDDEDEEDDNDDIKSCKIKALRAKTNTYIKTPVRGEEPVFVVTGRKEDVAKAKREILSAAEHFSQIRASRKNNLAGLGSGASTPPGPPANIPGHVTIQVRVPYRVVGLVVGPKGATIKRIQHQTHTYIVTPSRDKEPVFEVTGLPESVETARREIEAHIAMRTGNGTSINGLNGLGSLDDTDLLASLYKSGLNSLFSYFETPTDTFPTMTSSTGSSGAFSSSGSCSSSSSSSGGRGDLGAIWSSSDEELPPSPPLTPPTPRMAVVAAANHPFPPSH
ncbi:ring finger and kh domain containing protein 1 [Holotrichia oblita]|uniref:Ring finger and kh domain containing protein 1 n=1 Tax=Holotrichia oblita TaxID=644536 RepID=A0ACB9SW95_HOLOL|nr:ring finger and kh domain containing protein 1 [Holotrichia oblita]